MGFQIPDSTPRLRSIKLSLESVQISNFEVAVVAVASTACVFNQMETISLFRIAPPSFLSCKGAESSSLVQHSIAQIISAVAKIDLVAREWADLPNLLLQAGNGGNAAERAVAIYILFTILDTIGEGFEEKLRQGIIAIMDEVQNGVFDVNFEDCDHEGDWVSVVNGHISELDHVTAVWIAPPPFLSCKNKRQGIIEIVGECKQPGHVQSACPN
ncbi:unnamed protein product [Penicillium bialowiezense]